MGMRALCVPCAPRVEIQFPIHKSGAFPIPKIKEGCAWGLARLYSAILLTDTLHPLNSASVRVDRVPLPAFVINLDSASDRWDAMKEAFAGANVTLHRVPAIDGNALQFPHSDYAEGLFRLFHGRMTNPREVGCYLSHLAACQAFLETGGDRALIFEDDVTPEPGFEAVLDDLLNQGSHWNVIRLTGLSLGIPINVATLRGGHSICVGIGRLKGAGAYLVDRKAAQRFVEGLLPMRLPFDHAIDREWALGLRAAYVLPFPFSQTERGFRSSIQKGGTGKVPSVARWFTTYPYQAFNEISRWLCRGSSALVAKARSRG